VTFACHPIYSAAKDGEDCGLSLAQAESYQDPTSINKLDVVVQVCHPSYVGGICRKITIQAGPWEKRKILSEKQPKTKGLGNDRVPAKQV
jgi:hypothetical protein